MPAGIHPEGPHVKHGIAVIVRPFECPAFARVGAFEIARPRRTATFLKHCLCHEPGVGVRSQRLQKRVGPFHAFPPPVIPVEHKYLFEPCTQRPGRATRRLRQAPGRPSLCARGGVIPSLPSFHAAPRRSSSSGAYGSPPAPARRNSAISASGVVLLA